MNLFYIHIFSIDIKNCENCDAAKLSVKPKIEVLLGAFLGLSSEEGSNNRMTKCS